jgi:hypothetical protein
MTVDLHIDRLVLDGLPVPSLGASEVKAAVAAELERLLAGGAVGPRLRSPGALDRLAGGTVELGEHETPTSLGALIAAAVHAGIGR